MKKKRTFLVKVYKTETYSTEIMVEAISEHHAAARAEDVAEEKDLDWKYEESEIQAFDANELEDVK